MEIQRMKSAMSFDGAMIRRASDTRLLRRKSKMTKELSSSARKSMPLMRSCRTVKISDQDDTSGIWEGPEEFIRGRLLVEIAGFEPQQDMLRVKLRQNKRKHFWQKDRLDVVNSTNGEVFAGSARVQYTPCGFDLIGKNKIVVRCVENWNATEKQREIIICSTRPLSGRHVPEEMHDNFYRWFKATVDKTTNDFSLELWSGSQYYPLWYADDIAEGKEIVLTSVTDDVDVGKLCGDEIVTFDGVDPSMMICVGLAMQRLRIPS
jgi:hypothetical protein